MTELWTLGIFAIVLCIVGYVCYRIGKSDGEDSERIKFVRANLKPSRTVANLTRYVDPQGHPHYAVTIGCAGVEPMDHDARWLSTGRLTRQDAIAQVKEDFPHATISDLTGDKDGHGIPLRTEPATKLASSNDE